MATDPKQPRTAIPVVQNPHAPTFHVSAQLGMTMLRGEVVQVTFAAEQGVFTREGPPGRELVVAARMSMPLEAARALSLELADFLRRYDATKVAPSSDRDTKIN